MAKLTVFSTATHKYLKKKKRHHCITGTQRIQTIQHLKKSEFNCNETTIIKNSQVEGGTHQDEHALKLSSYKTQTCNI